MKIIITHAYSKENKGDAVLLSVLIADMRRVFDDPQITVLTMDRTAPEEKFDDAPVAGSLMRIAFSRYDNLFLKSSYCGYMAFATLIWAAIYRFTGKEIPLGRHLKKAVSYYKDADLAVPVGGGYLRGKPGWRSTFLLMLLLHPLVLCWILNKPVVIYPQSVGPFGNRFQFRAAAIVLKMVDRILVREEVSMKLLESMGVKNARRVVDSGFLFAGGQIIDLRRELGVPDNAKLVGITVRRWLNDDRQKNYEKNMAAFADRIIEECGVYVVFIPQVTAAEHNDDDRVASQRVYGLMKNKKKAVIYAGGDHYNLRSAYAKLDYLIGTRFHSVIFALTAMVPAIAIEYEHKTSGIMNDLGLGKWVVKIEDVEAGKLTDLFKNLVRAEVDYRRQLGRVLPGYQDKAKEAAARVRFVWEKKHGAAK